MKAFFYYAIETGGSSVLDGTMSNSSLTKSLFGIDCSLFISANRYITGCLLLTIIDLIIKILVDHIESVALRLPLLQSELSSKYQTNVPILATHLKSHPIPSQIPNPIP